MPSDLRPRLLSFFGLLEGGFKKCNLILHIDCETGCSQGFVKFDSLRIINMSS